MLSGTAMIAETSAFSGGCLAGFDRSSRSELEPLGKTVSGSFGVTCGNSGHRNESIGRLVTRETGR